MKINAVRWCFFVEVRYLKFMNTFTKFIGDSELNICVKLSNLIGKTSVYNNKLCLKSGEV